MRIIQVIQKPQLRGAEIFASQLSNHLVARGHEVVMVCLFAGPSKLPFDGKIILLNRPPSKRFTDFLGWRTFAKIVNEFKPDIIQSNAGDTLKFCVLSKMFARWRGPIVFRNANKVSDFITSWQKLLLNKFFVGKVDHIISVSELCRQDFVKLYQVNEKRTVTIPIGVELANDNQDLAEDIRAIFENRKVIVNVASLVPEKNHTAFINLASALRKQPLDFVILIIGDGKLMPVLQSQIEQAGLTEYVRLLGYRQDVPAMMQHASVMVLPSLIEGLPGVILEAFYNKLPVIANNVGGISEVVKNHETGWLVNKGDEAGLLSAVLACLGDAKKAKLITNTAYQMVTRSFANSVIAERFEHVYQQIVNHGR
jgi:L-malate glycosyltransferase